MEPKVPPKPLGKQQMATQKVQVRHPTHWLQRARDWQSNTFVGSLQRIKEIFKSSQYSPGFGRQTYTHLGPRKTEICEKFCSE